MTPFAETTHCASRAHCITCRKNPVWRTAVNAPDTCPHGVTHDEALYAKSHPEQHRNTGTVPNCCGRADQGEI